MKILLFVFFSLAAQSETIPPAPSCGDSCSAPMQAIEREFHAAGLPTRDLPILFSGECYHQSRAYNPEQAHHGFTLLEANETGLFMGGSFSFFAKENPYASLTLEEARKITPSRFDEDHRLSLTEEFAYADMNREDPEVPWRYWLKQSGQNLLMIGKWGHFHQLFCRFQKI